MKDKLRHSQIDRNREIFPQCTCPTRNTKGTPSEWNESTLYSNLIPHKEIKSTNFYLYINLLSEPHLNPVSILKVSENEVDRLHLHILHLLTLSMVRHDGHKNRLLNILLYIYQLILRRSILPLFFHCWFSFDAFISTQNH